MGQSECDSQNKTARMKSYSIAGQTEHGYQHRTVKKSQPEQDSRDQQYQPIISIRLATNCTDPSVKNPSFFTDSMDYWSQVIGNLGFLHVLS
jgi:hypothetical protein